MQENPHNFLNCMDMVQTNPPKNILGIDLSALDDYNEYVLLKYFSQRKILCEIFCYAQSNAVHAKLFQL